MRLQDVRGTAPQRPRPGPTRLKTGACARLEHDLARGAATLDQLQGFGSLLEREPCADDRLDKALRDQAIQCGSDLAVRLRLPEHIRAPPRTHYLGVAQQQAV